MVCVVYINILLCFCYYNNDLFNFLFLTTVRIIAVEYYGGLQNYAHLGHGLP